ncbi:hypothetical protein [Chitinophaga pinensis]|uniref:Cell wall surface anchor family protein n=1 Tax=Chitinophaga pinensis (strain ATCC 43595 / DSM 2588 / LMG 13176 / NBRC 15968 / NCIMB 11800 / UQM 2034) TaxID=485918 RepID=A0A979GB31_CHIPD|nr:hypothetical protein [Chitinophaga pinensis]ACU64033.1 hypothetical protein Cpin_6629 [Chitinophaga pinensis DSM 2588]
MKSVIRNTSRTLVLAGGITLAATAANAQMKIGDNPSQITKSAILELSSTKQGLLLPRIPNFTAIDAAIGTDPVDGMVVYLASGTATTEGIYMRKAGAWVKIASTADALANWSLKGNTGTTAADYIGTADAQPLSIRTNGVEAIGIQADRQVKLSTVNADNTTLEVIMLSAAGIVSKRTLPQTAFNTLFNNIKTTADSANAAFNVTENVATGEVTVNAPILAPSTTATYGFLKKSDWDKLQALSSGNNLSIADFITTVAAAEVNRGGRISYDAATASYKLELVAASATQAGIVTTGVQTFGGDKTFNGATTVGNTLNVTGAATLGNNLSVAGTSTLTGATTVGGTLGVAGAANLGNNLTVTGATTLNTLAVTNATTLNGTVDLTSVANAATATSYDVLVREGSTVTKRPFDLDAIAKAIRTIKAGTGTTDNVNVNFKTDSLGTNFDIQATTNDVSFNLPNASAVDASHTVAQRGVVSTGNQSFAGNKSFAAAVAVGTNAPANSTLQVNGSVQMRIYKTAVSYTLTDTDNTVLADATSGALTITLPAPAAAIAGRIYTIKKVGTGDINKAVKIQPAAGTIEGGADYMIYNDWTFITVQTDGVDWYIIRK